MGAKENKPAESQPNVEVAESEVSSKLHSVDFDNGIVVFKTDAKEDTGFTCKINSQEVKASVENGQLWFYAGKSITQSPIIELQ